MYPAMLFEAMGTIYINYPSWMAANLDRMRLVRLTIYDHGRKIAFLLHCKTTTTIQTLKRYIVETDPAKRCPSWSLAGVTGPHNHLKIVNLPGMHLFIDHHLYMKEDDATIGDYMTAKVYEYWIDVYWNV